MLNSLLIKNYALIEHLEFQPHAQLNIITGETGAGKSIMLGAIGLLLGNRADTKMLYNPQEKCIIEGHYDISGYFIQNIFEEEELDYDRNCIIRREISPQGKSRAFVNDTPVNLETLRKITSELMDVHSQHDSISLGSNEYQLQIVDTFAQNEDRLSAYRADFKQYRKAQEQYDNLLVESKEIKKEFDYNSFLFDELSKARLQANEQDKLEKELIILENAEEVKNRLQTALSCLQNPEQSIISLMQNVLGSLNSIASINPVFTQFRDRTQSCLIELKDLASEIENEEESTEIDNEKIDTIQERLNLIYNLQQKHQAKTNQELLNIQENLHQKVSKVLNLDETLNKAKTLSEKSYQALLKTANLLSKSRQSVLSTIETQIAALLIDLGMPNASLKIEYRTDKPSLSGTDYVNVLFSANKGIKPSQLKNVASGGEFSRLMLAIKYILANKRSLPTIVFDEIDTGVSGEISIKVGNMMREMARGHQIIAITHLHQIAAKGDNHYFVYKDNSSTKTVSRIRKLTTEERVTEIAQMIGGSNPSKSVLENAREILSQQLLDKTNYKLDL